MFINITYYGRKSFETACKQHKNLIRPVVHFLPSFAYSIAAGKTLKYDLPNSVL